MTSRTATIILSLIAIAIIGVVLYVALRTPAPRTPVRDPGHDGGTGVRDGHGAAKDAVQ
jgi:hypothetical protein